MHYLLPLQTRTLSSELSSLPGSSIVTLGGTARGFAEMPGHRVEKGDHKPERCQTGGLNSGYIPYIYTPYSGYQKLLVCTVTVKVRQNSLFDRATNG